MIQMAPALAYLEHLINTEGVVNTTLLKDAKALIEDLRMLRATYELGRCEEGGATQEGLVELWNVAETMWGGEL